MKAVHKKSASGFTLIEIILVITLLSILLSIIIIAINPSKQLSDSRDIKRESDVLSIVQALYQYAADNEGDFPAGLNTTDREICRTDATDCAGLYDFSDLTDNETYMITIPLDPQCELVSHVCSDNGTGYFAGLTASGRVTISASSSENRLINFTQ